MKIAKIRIWVSNIIVYYNISLSTLSNLFIYFILLLFKGLIKYTIKSVLFVLLLLFKNPSHIEKAVHF
jgi:hypothetical protein